VRLTNLLGHIRISNGPRLHRCLAALFYCCPGGSRPGDDPNRVVVPIPVVALPLQLRGGDCDSSSGIAVRKCL